MAQRRVSEFSLNYDSLTDLITNLAGGLIMLVLLLFGMTKGTTEEARARDSLRRPPPTKTDPNASRKAATLKTEVRVLEAQDRDLDERLARLREEAEELKRLAASQQPAEHEDPAGRKDQAALVTFRPPMMREAGANEKVSAFFVFMKQSIFMLDFVDYTNTLDELISELQATAQRGGDIDQYEKGVVRRLQGGDFDFKFQLLLIREKDEVVGAAPIVELIPKPGATGEGRDAAFAARSNYLGTLDRLQPETQYISFFVYPDSFELFRDARDLAMRRRFSYNWEPMQAGTPIQLGAGRPIRY